MGKGAFKELLELRKESKLLRTYQNIVFLSYIFIILTFIPLAIYQTYGKNLEAAIPEISMLVIIIFVVCVILFLIFKYTPLFDVYMKLLLVISSGKDSFKKAYSDQRLMKREIIIILFSFLIYYFILFYFLQDVLVPVFGKFLFLTFFVFAAGFEGLISLAFYILRYFELSRKRN